MNEPEAGAALWRQASAQFDELWDLAEDEREARLESLRQVAPDLAREVAELLAAALRAGERFDHAPAVTGSSTDPSSPEDAEDANATASGERFGSWKLVEPLGAGGMGEVWVAERADGAYSQRAALKLLKRGLDSAAILERFARERQILAGLQHPAIARLLDGGISDGGRPYLVMELAAGQPITRACDALGLDLDARLRTFLAVCEAVSAAHRSLVVHRDLKPSNVLLSDSREVKLLDFGIAKLLDDSSRSEMTAYDLAAMTPAYAAPEQILGAPITTATDVYGLGAVLYELVTGARPHRRTATTPAGLVRELETEVVRPPSEVVRDFALGDRQPRERRALARRIHGDLDAVLLQALASDPGRRYPSVTALADDLERFLSQRPVAARRAVPGAAAWKFLARHRVAVVATAVIALTIVVATGEALRQGVRAHSEARHAERVQEFLLAMFQGADPSRTLGEALTALEVVDQGARQLTRGLAEEPEARAVLEQALAMLYRTLGRSDTALGLATQSRKEFSSALGPTAPRTLLAHLTELEIRSDLGELEPTRAALDELLPALARAFGSESRELLRARSALGGVLEQQGEFQANLELQRELAIVARRVHGESSLETAMALESLGSAQGEVALFADAQATLLESLAMLERLGAGASPQAVVAETTLAEVLEAAGQNDEANAGYHRALERGRKVLGSNHPQVAQILVKQGFLLTNLRQLPEARAVLNEALAIFQARSHYETGSALRYLGQVELFDERFAEAKITLDRAEQFLRDRLGEDHMLTWAAVVSSAQARMKLGELAEAERMQRAAIAALTRIHGAQTLEVRTPMKHLGETLRLSGRPEEAIDLHRRALAIERQLLGDDLHRPIALSKQQLALDLAAVGKRPGLDEARQLVDEAVAYFRDHEPEASRIGEALAVSGRVAAAAGDASRARVELSRALEILTALRRPSSPALAELRRDLAALPDPRSSHRSG